MSETATHLPKDTIQQTDAVEKFFCEPFEKLDRHPLTREQSGLLIQLFMASQSGNKDFPESEEKPFMYQMVEGAIESRFSFSVSDSTLILFLAVISENPGGAIMYLTYIQYWCSKNKVQEFTWDHFNTRVFPFGLPSRDDLTTLWDSQKVERGGDGFNSDNLLDYSSATISIMNINTDGDDITEEKNSSNEESVSEEEN